MKNHIVFKFIAIVLCAACLMGVVGGVAGVAVLSSADLYSKTVDQVMDQRIQGNCSYYAREIALIYASRELGGCSEAMMQERQSNNLSWFESSYPNFGYAILDAEGNVLAGSNQELKGTVASYTIPVTGQYMHLVSSVTQTEQLAKQQSEALANSDVHTYFSPDLLDGGTVDVFEVLLTFADGSSARYNGDSASVGEVQLYQNSYVRFASFEPKGYDSAFLDQAVTSVSFSDIEGDPILEMSAAQGVGTFSVRSDGCILFTSYPLSALASDAAQSTEGVLADADGELVPAEGVVVNEVSFSTANGRVIYEASCGDSFSNISTYYDLDENGNSSSYGHAADAAGFLFYNQAGQLVYHSFLFEVEEPSTSIVYGMQFYSADTGFTFQVEDPNGLGTLTRENDHLIFTSFATAAKETEATPAVEEIVPETPAETLVAETAPAETESEIYLDEEGNPVDAAGEPIAAAVDGEGAEAETYTDEASGEDAEAYTEEYTDESSEEWEKEEDAEWQEEDSEDWSESEEWTEAEDWSESEEGEPLPPETAAPETEPVVETTAAATVPEETAETVPEEMIPETTEPVEINGKPLSAYQINRTEHYDSELSDWVTSEYVYVPMPELTVEMYVDRAAMTDAAVYDLLGLVREYRSYLLPMAGVCLLFFAVLVVYLCTAAGRKPKTEEVRAGGLNRIPLDLYLVGGGFIIACIIAYGWYGAQMLLRQDFLAGCVLGVSAAYLCCLIFVGFCFALVAQFRTPGGFWWRNSLCGLCIRGFMKFAVWLETWLATKGGPVMGRGCKKLWEYIKLGSVWLYHVLEKAANRLIDIVNKSSHWVGVKLQRFLSLLPLTWQWLLGGCTLIFISALCISDYNSPNVILIGILLCLVIVFYAAHCFGKLAESTKRMSKGDLDSKVDDKLMAGCFKEFAGDLNDLAGVAVVAAQKQLKSERMKTELITNVSHDIKTPLTSIINYVDLLQKPHTDEEEAQYLEVLDRQSQRLKKLIDDLMEMSKASTGNMAVDITRVDAVESVNQALGEFADKLDKAQLYPVFRHEEDQVPMMADGKLVWRVMSNLLSNAVKYAMPGTRLYIDLMSLEGKVILSIKNISREELNVDADELMERFVRGDDSRNTEGSGLGLNIAKSLMELQKGQLQLLVDGDLFKVTLIFPGA